MQTASFSTQRIAVIFMLVLLTACAPALTSTPIVVEPAVTDVPSPASTLPYVPVSDGVCQILQEDASKSLGLTFTMEASTPFNDYVSGETGQGCSLTANTNGASISDPNDALTKLVNGFIGWTEESQYQAGGPTGAATGLTRDAGLMLVSVDWQPSAEVTCPADQPISACPLTAEQKIYTVKIQAAMK